MFTLVVSTEFGEDFQEFIMDKSPVKIYVGEKNDGLATVKVYDKSINLTNNKYFWRCTDLANIKSAKKRVLTSQVRADRNKAVKSRVKTYIKKVDAAVAANDKEAAQAALPVAIAEISKAASKGIFHKNTAARKVSRITKAVNSL